MFAVYSQINENRQVTIDTQYNFETILTFLQKRPERANKKVRWSPDVSENEHCLFIDKRVRARETYEKEIFKYVSSEEEGMKQVLLTPF